MIYHVFLSFRGEDTRKTFTDHLYTALSGAGFRTFRDDDGIERGKNVKSELDKAIKEARSSIVVLSNDYSSSGWCLDELVMILERKRTSSGAGHVVLPVFYDVDPSQVRKQTGSFGEAFGRHEERLNAETNESKKEYLRKKVQLWRGALREVADLAGMVLKNQADGSLETMTNLPNLLRSLYLKIDGSKVVEVQGMFKLEPIGNVDAEIINEMGLSSELEAMGSLEVELYNRLNSECIYIMKGSLQVLHECGIYNIFLPRSEVPAGWCSSYKRRGSSITFNMPSLPNLKIQALKIYVVFAFSWDFAEEILSGNFDYITLYNVTKGLKWAYTPLFEYVQRDEGTMVWLSHWKIGNQIILEAGDEANVSAGLNVSEDGRFHRDFPGLAEEIGVHIVYDEPEEKGSQHHKAYTRHQNVTNVGDLSEYQLTPGYYHLCHHGHHRTYHQAGDGIVGESEKVIFGESEDIAGGSWFEDHVLGLSMKKVHALLMKSVRRSKRWQRWQEEKRWWYSDDEESARFTDEECTDEDEECTDEE
ncbi:hypothetical protein RHMOL_Rhmol05G0229100 [Rhododendron molle]|uniref:Uncharacterized protein n=1 Tax=Rhododendron molle TaxID=49168 RepID=A0ACC0NTE2_RHOML|nr:hypothetical protein RHMOL_Rhmol05G0229100 [Rhododendron molle]